MTKRTNQNTRAFCRRVTEIARTDPILAKAVAGRDVGEMVLNIGGAANVKAFIEHARQVTADAIVQAGKEFGGIPPELKRWDLDI